MSIMSSDSARAPLLRVPEPAPRKYQSVGLRNARDLLRVVCADYAARGDLQLADAALCCGPALPTETRQIGGGSSR